MTVHLHGKKVKSGDGMEFTESLCGNVICEPPPYSYAEYLDCIDENAWCKSCLRIYRKQHNASDTSHDFKVKASKDTTEV